MKVDCKSQMVPVLRLVSDRYGQNIIVTVAWSVYRRGVWNAGKELRENSFRIREGINQFTIQLDANNLGQLVFNALEKVQYWINTSGYEIYKTFDYGNAEDLRKIKNFDFSNVKDITDPKEIIGFCEKLRDEALMNAFENTTPGSRCCFECYWCRWEQDRCLGDAFCTFNPEELFKFSREDSSINCINKETCESFKERDQSYLMSILIEDPLCKDSILVNNLELGERFFSESPGIFYLSLQKRAYFIEIPGMVLEKLFSKNTCLIPERVSYFDQVWKKSSGETVPLSVGRYMLNKKKKGSTRAIIVRKKDQLEVICPENPPKWTCWDPEKWVSAKEPVTAELLK